MNYLKLDLMVNFLIKLDNYNINNVLKFFKNTIANILKEMETIKTINYLIINDVTDIKLSTSIFFELLQKIHQSK
jgi:hypothetical protein